MLLSSVQSLCLTSGRRPGAQKPQVSLPAYWDFPLPWAGEQGCMREEDMIVLSFVPLCPGAVLQSAAIKRQGEYLFFCDMEKVSL